MAFGGAPRSFEQVDDLVAALRDELGEGVTVLVKGSRGARMERVVAGSRRQRNRGRALMLYALANHLQPYYSGFNLFGYLTFRAILGVLTALIFCFVAGPGIIRRLQVLKFGQVIRTDGPQSHLKKTGTPTMGGAMILAGIAIATLAVGRSRRTVLSGSRWCRRWPSASSASSTTT